MNILRDGMDGLVVDGDGSSHPKGLADGAKLAPSIPQHLTVEAKPFVHFGSIVDNLCRRIRISLALGVAHVVSLCLGRLAQWQREL